MKNKKLILEQNTIDLKRAYSVGCFTNDKYTWFTIGGEPQPKAQKDGLEVITGVNKDGQEIRFYADGSVKNIVTGKKMMWKCPELEETTSVTADVQNLTPDQKKYIDDQVKYDPTYSSTKPSDYEVDKGKYQVVDLNTLNPKLFPTKDKFFLWKRVGDISVAKQQQDVIKSELETAGYTFVEPDVTSYLHKTEEDIRTVLGGKYAKYYTTYVPVWKTEKAESTVMSKDELNKFKDEMKKGIVNRGTCRTAVNLLYNAYKLPGRTYFKNDNELLNAKNTAKKCATQGKQFLGKVEDRLNFLKGLKGKFGLLENTKKLDNIISKTLKESITNKKMLMKESNQVSKRLSRIISENNENIASDFIYHINVMKRSGFKDQVINEGIGDMFSSLLGNSGTGVVEYFKFKIAGWLLEKFNVDPKSWVGEIITQTFANLDLKDYGRFFTDCKFTSELLAQSITEAAGDKFMKARGMDSPIYEILLQTTAETFFNSETVDAIEKKIYSFICPQMSTLKKSVSSVVGSK